MRYTRLTKDGIAYLVNGDGTYYSGDEDECYRFATDRLAEIENRIECGDLAEVVRGHWIIHEYEYLNCSLCGQAYYTGCDSFDQARHRLEAGEMYPYCPYCGAKMGIKNV